MFKEGRQTGCRNNKLEYEKRLKILELSTLAFRRLQGDMIGNYKIVKQCVKQYYYIKTKSNCMIIPLTLEGTNINSSSKGQINWI